MLHAWFVVDVYSMMMTSSSFTAGVPLPDDVACAMGTCVASMSQLTKLRVCDLPLPLLKAMAERTEPLEGLRVWSPGVNWVSVHVFCQCMCQILDYS